MGWLSLVAPMLPEEGGVPEGEDPAVEGGQPVALAVRGGRHGHDRTLQRRGAQRALEGGVAEGEDAAVRAGQPVSLAVRRRRADLDGRIEGLWHGRGAQRHGAEPDHAPAGVGVRRQGRSARPCGRTPDVAVSTDAKGMRANAQKQA